MEETIKLMTDVTNAGPEPAWGNPSQVRLYDGSPFLLVAVDVLPGFAIIELSNRTASALAWVSCAVTPVKGDLKLLTRWAPASIQPSSRVIIPVAYTCGGTCECQVLVTFKRHVQGSAGTRVHACQARASLIPTSRDSFQSTNTWRPLLLKLARKEFQQVPETTLPPPAIVERLDASVGDKMHPLEGSLNGRSIAWGSLDPIIIAVFPDTGTSYTLYGTDIAQLDAAAAAPVTNDARAREAAMFELGVATTTLRDGLLLGTRADHVRPAANQVARLVGSLGLHVPSLAGLFNVLDSREDLGNLNPTEKKAYEQALAEIEHQVSGRPS